MNRFLKWLGNKLFGKKPAGQSLRQTGARISPAARAPHPQRRGTTPAKTAPVPGFDLLPGAGIEDGGPGKNVLIRNRFIREDTGTHDTLKILDDSILEPEDEGGIDPYNTGRFDRSKSWNSRIRK